jgi:hypothetical protein
LVATKTQLVLIGLVSIASTSCRSGDMQEPASKQSIGSRLDTEVAVGTLAGVGAFGPETQAFFPCGGSEAWWLEFDERTPELDQQLREQEATDLRARLEECDRKTGLVGCDRWAYLELDGIRSRSGQYGHMGGYSREVRVRKVLRVGRDVPSNCVVRRLTGR